MQPLDRRTSLPVYFLPFMAAVTALSPLSIDAYLPSFPAIAEEFGVDRMDVNFTMSTYLAGLAMGQLLGGPISDQIGRKQVGLLGLTIYVGFTLLILTSGSLDQLALWRAFQALGGGMASSVVMPTIRDVSAPEKAASRIAMMVLFMLLAPLIAPLIGILLLNLGWRFIFGFLCVYGGIVGLVYLLGVKETRAKSTSIPNFLKIFHQYLSVVNHQLDGKIFPIRYALASSFATATMMIYLTYASFIFQTYFGITMGWFPAFFAVNVIFFAVAQAFSARYLRNRNLQQISSFFRLGHRLQLGSTAILFVSVLLFDPPLWYFVTLLACSLGCIGFIGPSGSGVYLAAFNRLSGSASALLTVSMFLFGAILGAISGLFRTGDLLPTVAAIFGASLIANLLVIGIPRADEVEVLEKLGCGEIEPL